MNDKNYRKYPKEFKLQALELYQSSGKSAAQIERDLGITTGMLLKWRDQYQVKQTSTTTELEPTDMAAAQREIIELKRELAMVKEERDILKKAINIFSQKSG